MFHQLAVCVAMLRENQFNLKITNTLLGSIEFSPASISLIIFLSYVPSSAYGIIIKIEEQEDGNMKTEKQQKANVYL